MTVAYGVQSPCKACWASLSNRVARSVTDESGACGSVGRSTAGSGGASTGRLGSLICGGRGRLSTLSCVDHFGILGMVTGSCKAVAAMAHSATRSMLVVLPQLVDIALAVARAVKFLRFKP